MDPKQIVDDNSEWLPIAWLFCDAHFEEHKFPRLLFLHPSPSFEFSYIKKKIKQTSVNKKIAYYITNTSSKTMKN